MITILQAAKFANANKRKAFKDWKLVDWIIAIDRAVKEEIFYHSVNSKGELDGIFLGRLEGSNLHTTAIVTTTNKALQAFLSLYEKQYAEYELKAFRRGKPVIFNSRRLVKLLKHHGRR